jgi:hypothetical protein
VNDIFELFDYFGTDRRLEGAQPGAGNEDTRLVAGVVAPGVREAGGSVATLPPLGESLLKLLAEQEGDGPADDEQDEEIGLRSQ